MAKKKEYRICKRVYIDEYGEENFRYYIIQYKKLYFFRKISKWETVQKKRCYESGCYKVTLEFDTFDGAKEFLKTKLRTGIKRQTTKDSEIRTFYL